MSDTIIRRFGAPPGAPGVEVVERPSVSSLADPRFGAAAMFGVLKRGPMGVAIPVSSRRQYDMIFGDPRESTWHLFADGSHLTPDAIDGFFQTSAGAGTLLVTRLDLDGKARAASVVLKSRSGQDVLRVNAANEGRWGGKAGSVPWTPVITCTSRTFACVSPGVMADEFVGAIAQFEDVSGKEYQIISNTESAPGSGEVVFTVAAQYDLIADGVSGPAGLSGLASYSRYQSITGTIAYPLLMSTTGTTTLSQTTLLGSGTSYSSELQVGSNVYFAGEARVVTSITSNTTATIDAPFELDGEEGVTLETENRTITGTETTFETDLEEGQTLFVEINGERQGRVVAEIISDTELVLNSGYTEEVPASTQVSVIGLEVTGSDSSFTTELSAGDVIVDPFRAGEAVTVAEVVDDSTIVLSRQFSGNFTDVQLAVQAGRVDVELTSSVDEGLAVVVGQGSRFPETHFSLNIYFNGSLVLAVPDVSLDRSDPLFVEDAVNEIGSNVAYRASGKNYQTWVTCESLWDSAYTTSKQSDVRPANGSGTAMAVTRTRLYTVADFEYKRAIGHFLLPNPYEEYRNQIRITDAAPPIEIPGTVSSTDLIVNGTGTVFTEYFMRGDYLYDPHTNTVRQITGIISDTEMRIDAPFPQNMPALTKAMRAGYVQVGQSNDLTVASAVGEQFMVAYPTSLTSGYDGNMSHLLPFYWSKFFDLDVNHLENAAYGRNYGLIRFAAPGVTDISIINAAKTYAENTSYEYRAELPLSFQTAPAAESYINQELGRSDFITLAFPSYGYISNPLGSGQRLVPLSGVIMGGESRVSVDHQGYHHPFAGVRATLTGVTGLPFEVPRSDEGVANTAGLQIIKMVAGNIVCWGDRLPSQTNTYRFIHIRRCQSNYNRIFIEASALQELLFQPNQPDLASKLNLILRNFTRREYQKGVLARQLTFQQAVQINMGGSNNSSIVADEASRDEIVEIINGALSVSLRVTYSGVLERLVLNIGPDTLVSEFGNTLDQATSA